MTEPNYNRVSGILTSYWKGAVVHSAVKVGIFDALWSKPMQITELMSKLGLDICVLENVLDSLEFMNLIEIQEDFISLTKDGSILASGSPYSLSNSSLMWWEEHLQAWINLDYSLKSGKPAFEYLYGVPFFQWLENNPNQRSLYHKSMSEYARIDYQEVSEIISNYSLESIIDLGGGGGVLVDLLYEKIPETKISLLDLPEVVSDIAERLPAVDHIQGDLFNLPEVKFDAAILSRILHDWDDIKCQEILEEVKNILNAEGYLFIIERLTERKEHSLLNLDLKIITNGKERTFDEYQSLCNNAGFNFLQSYPIKSSLNILVFVNSTGHEKFQ